MERHAPRVGYVLKTYPRFSETFIVNEILAHERAGAELEICSLRPPTGGRFHPDIGEVRAPVAYVPAGGLKAETLWAAARRHPAGLPALLADPDAEAPGDAHQAIAVAEWAAERGIEHLHAHFASAAAQVTRLAARLADVPYSFTAHAKDIFHADVDRDRLARRIADAHAVITVSDFNVRHLNDVAPEAAGHVHRVYNGLDLRRFPYASPGARPRTVVAVGRLVEKKGFADLVDALALLAREGRTVPCRIAGEGPLAGELGARISARGLDGSVTLTGPLTQAEIRALVQSSAVLAAPCVVGEDGNRDGLPTVLLEALALGTPAVATPVTGIPELVRHEETGLLVGERDPAALAAALARLLDDRDLADRLARAGRELIEAEFDADETAARIRAIAWPVPVPLAQAGD